MDNKRRIVVKVGTNVMTNKDNRILGPVFKKPGKTNRYTI